MMKALVFGAGGMLGRALVAELDRLGDVVAVPHGEVDITDLLSVLNAFRAHEPLSVVFNAAGVLNTSKDNIAMAQANAVGPHVLANATGQFDIPLVHVSTDCVFSGRSVGRWAPPREGLTTIHIPDPIDLYGRTKLVGEIDAPHVTVVRTSFVGPDHGLWPWLVEQAENGATVEGWTEARWSGSTVWAVARALTTVPSRAGILHLATEQAISKNEALILMRDALGLDVEIVETNRFVIDRALYPTHILQPFAEALKERPQ